MELPEELANNFEKHKLSVGETHNLYLNTGIYKSYSFFMNSLHAHSKHFISV